MSQVFKQPQQSVDGPPATTQLRDVEAERDRLALRLAAAEAQQAEQAQRANDAELALAEQVGQGGGCLSN